MKTQSVNHTLLLVAAVALLVWNVMDARPATVVTAAPAGQAAPGSISVSGSSAIRVQPDRVVVVFGVESFAESPREARSQNAQSSQAVIKAIRAQDVAERDIATAEFSIQPRYKEYETSKLSGYTARNTIVVTLRDVRKLEPVLVAALEAGVVTVDGVEFSVTNMRALRDQAREKAVQAALEKARDMAGAAEMKVGRVTSIQENTGGYYFGWWGGNRQWSNYQNVVQDLSAEGAIVLEDGSISLGQIVVQAQVSLTAELVDGG